MSRDWDHQQVVVMHHAGLVPAWRINRHHRHHDHEGKSTNLNSPQNVENVGMHTSIKSTFFLFLAFQFFFRSEGVIKEVSPMMRWWKWKHFHGGCLDGYIFVCNEEDLLFLSILSPSTFLVVAMNVLPEIRWDMKSLSATSSWTLWIHACIS